MALRGVIGRWRFSSFFSSSLRNRGCIYPCTSNVPLSPHHNHINHRHYKHALFSTTSSSSYTPGAIVTTATPREVFHQAADETLECIVDALEDENVDPQGVLNDADAIDGVLTVVVDGVGTWVLNKHGVTKQLWLSSPLSGPSKYNYHTEDMQWRDERQQRPLQPLLEQEFSDSLKSSVRFSESF